MKLAVLFCVFALFLSECFSLGYHADVGIPEAARIRKNEASLSSRIIGGMPSSYGDNPYLAGLLITLMRGQMSVCGGTIVSTSKILTAGQCWYDGYQQGRKIQVVVGTLKLFSGWRRDVTAISIHPGFDALTPANDLAMLTLRPGYEIYFNSYQSAVLLPTIAEVNNTFEGVSARVSGFGKTSDWSSIGPESAQQAISVPVMRDYECYWSLGPAVTGGVICTSGVNGWGTCAGDVGGPLVIPKYFNGSDLLIGVTSIQSPLGCQNGFPTGYTRVTAYIDWIQNNL